ncbi:MAG: tol-pal system YbgF family protein [Myxococcota bacterium]
MLRRLLAVVLVGALFSASASAASKKEPVEDEATKKAKTLFKAAETDFALGRFQEALEGYSMAYEAKPLPAMLFNIGQCHFELANFERAIFFYEQFLRGDVDTKKRQLANKRLQEAKVAYAAAEEKRQREEANERERQELAMRAQEQAHVAAMKQAELDAQRLRITEETTAPPIYKKWWFWAAAAGVVAITATSIILATGGGEDRLPSGELPTIDARDPL